MAHSAAQMRAWTGPAVFSFGFRPFFLMATIWATLAMILWVLLLAGQITLPTAFDPVSWHAHAFLFGYLPAVVAGFLLTAVPNWTGRLPVVGWRLAWLSGLWVIGRIAVLCSDSLDPLLVAALDLSCLGVLAVMLAREIIAGKNWRNLVVLAMVAILLAGGGLFHWEASTGDVAAHCLGLRIALAAAVLMISVIGGRIIPSFTRNWLAQRNDLTRPAPPMQRFDKATLLMTVPVLALWVWIPGDQLTGWGLTLMSVVHLGRLSRWGWHRTYAEPLVWVLHVAYAFVPLGAAALALSILWPETISVAAAQHMWMAGAIGMMTLAVMTRATLGHSGRPLHAGSGTVLIYLAMLASVLTRLCAGLELGSTDLLYQVSGGLWCVAFGGFVLLYGSMLVTRRKRT